jgi:predicted AlkP superfamily phosphohydrolase/phosphomutase
MTRKHWFLSGAAVLLVALGVVVWLTGYTTVPDEHGWIYVAERGGGCESVPPGSELWLWPLFEDVVQVKAGLNELRRTITVPAKNGGLELELVVDLELDTTVALAGVERWGADFPDALLAEFTAEGLAGYSYAGTVEELYGDGRDEAAAEIAALLDDWLGDATVFEPRRVALPSAPNYHLDGYPTPKVIVLGIDALDDELLEGMLELDLLPNFARLRREGYLDRLDSEPPYFSPMVWNTMATGKSAEEHGIEGFVYTDPETGDEVPYSAADREVSAFWEALGDYDADSIVVNWYYTWPTGEMDGWILTNYAWEPQYGKGFTGVEGFDELEGKTWPPDLLEEVDPVVDERPYIAEEDYPLHEELGMVPAPADELNTMYPLPHYLERDILAANAMFYLMDEKDWHIAAVYQEFPDVLCHLAWPVHAFHWERLTGEPANLPQIPPERREMADVMAESVIQSYQLADKLLGMAMERWGDEAVILVVSDHGFDTIYPSERILIGDDAWKEMHFWHDPDGVFALWGPNIRQGAVGDGVTIYDFLPTLLAAAGLPVPADMPGEIAAEAFEPGYYEWYLAGPQAEAPATWDTEKRDVGSELAQALTDAELERLRALGYLQ